MVAKQEDVSLGFLEKKIKSGRIVIPVNKKRTLEKPTAIGEGLKIKINTNIGTSTEKNGIKDEIEKLKAAIALGTDTVMDLSVGENIKKTREKIIKECSVPLGTVPIYEAAIEVEERKGSFEKMAFDDIWNVLKKQAEEGVDFFTIHSGILKKSIQTIKHKRRVGGIVSRGGAILTRWMYVNKKENPLYENFDKILELAKKYHITISLGDALRPGAIADSTDELQLNELYVLGKLIKKCRKAGVQAMVEGPGHIRLDEIGFNVMLEKKICSNAPFYILGPLPTDFATGYDHITSAIGGSIAGLWGADFLCVVTPAEHLRLPTLKDIEEGVIASRIAAHSVDVLRFKREWNKDRKLSIYRAKRNWHKVFPLTVNKIKAEKKRKTSQTSLDMCSMCGKFCSLKISESCNILKNI